MLRSANSLFGYVLEAVDGDVGRCKDFLFDDDEWVIRHMVADTGKWLPDRKVAISPLSLNDPDWQSRRLPVNMTRKQIENAPSLQKHQPISRQYEMRLFRYYGHPAYWGDKPSLDVSKPEAETSDAQAALAQTAVATVTAQMDGPNLRSIQEVTGYHIEATDDEIGHVEDFVIDTTGWFVRYMVVDTRNWLPGRKVLVAPTWIRQLDWAGEKVHVSLNTDQIEASPVYDPSRPVNREYEEQLYDFYGRPTYW